MKKLQEKIDSVNSQIRLDLNISKSDTVISTLSLLATKATLGKIYSLFQPGFWMKMPPNVKEESNPIDKLDVLRNKKKANKPKVKRMLPLITKRKRDGIIGID